MSSRRSSRKKSSIVGGASSAAGRRKSGKAAAVESTDNASKPLYWEDHETPISDEKPNYDELKDPLSVRETRTLIHSLEVSRNAWLSGSMFEKYWTRPPRGQKLKEGEVNAREKMTKLCECCMAIGPHFFDVKLFLCKDETGIPKEDPEEKLRLEAEQRRREYELSQQRLREENEKRAQEEAERKAKEAEHMRKLREEAEKRAKAEGRPWPPPPPPPHIRAQLGGFPPPPPPGFIPPISGGSVKPTHIPPMPSPLPSSPAGSSAQPQFIDPIHAQQIQSRARAEAQARANAQSQDSPSSSVASGHVSEPITSASNQLVIARLQALARQDQALNALMQIVATGNATNEQMSAFQIYIQRARNMSIPIEGMRNRTPKPPKVKAPKPPKPPKMPKPPAIQKERKTKGTYQSKKNMKDIMIVFEFKDNPTDRYILPRESIVEVLPNGAVLVSFLVLHNRDLAEIRREFEDQVKKDAAKKEVKQEGESETTVSAGDAAAANENGTTEDAQNKSDANATTETKKEPVNDVPATVAEPPLRKSRRSAAHSIADTEAHAAAVSKPRKRGGRGGAAPAAEKDITPIVAEIKPVFTALTITMRDVPRKSIPMVQRSVTRRDLVYPKMEEIIKTGERAKDYHVWYKIERSDTQLLEKQQKPAEPPSNMYFPARKREYKPRPKKDGEFPRKRKKSDLMGDDSFDDESFIKEEPEDDHDGHNERAEHNDSSILPEQNHENGPSDEIPNGSEDATQPNGIAQDLDEAHVDEATEIQQADAASPSNEPRDAEMAEAA